MKNISTEKAHEAAFSGGSVSDALNAASCADMAPPSSNRGVQKPKTPAHSKKPLNVTKPISWTVKATS